MSKCPHVLISQYGELPPTNGWDRLASWDSPANFNGFRVLASLPRRRRLTEVNQTARCLAVSWAGTLHVHRVSKNVPPLACYNLTHMNGFWYFFGRNVTDKVGNQKVLYYATSNNLCFCTTCQNGETWKSHFSLNWIVLQTQRTCALSSWKKNCHLWCVW